MGELALAPSCALVENQRVRCSLCSSQVRQPDDPTLLRPAFLVYCGDSGDRPRKLTWGYARNGWFVVTAGSRIAEYCPRHKPGPCLRHAARVFGLVLPEGVR